LEIVTDQADYKEVDFLFADVREVERGRPAPRVIRGARVSEHGIEAFRRNGAWVAGEIGRRRGTMPTVVFRGAALPPDESSRRR
jgi:hypothetical protein